MNKKIIIGIALSFLLLATIGFTYAYFSGGVTGNEEAKNQIVETGTLSLVYTDGPEIILNNAYPGNKIEKTFTVENTGTLDTSYTIYLKDLINNFTNDELLLSYTCTSYIDGVETGTCENLENLIIPFSTSPSEVTIKPNIPIDASITHEYKLTILFKETNSIQNYNQGKSFTGVINISETHEYKCAINTFEEGTLGYKMLSDNCAYADNTSSTYVTSETGINFGEISSDTNGKGLYYTTDLTRTEDIDGDGEGERVYYYRGAVDNNYLVFADFCWRLIRTNEDGSIRLRYSGEPTIVDGITSCPQTGTNVGIDNGKGSLAGAYNSNYFSLEKSNGYTHDKSTTDTTQVDSTAKSTIDAWYTSTIESQGTMVTSLIVDEPYCNDRSVGFVDSTSTSYGAYTRFVRNIMNPTPQYKCPNAEDKYTVNAANGNGKLSKPIALLTIDEVAYAGGAYDFNTNKTFYLYTKAYYWTMTPAYSVGDSLVFDVAYEGHFNHHLVDYTSELVPAISLSAEAIVADGGLGTYDHPYVIVP